MEVLNVSKPSPSSAALPIAYVVLRILIVVNWLMGAAILALLVVAPHEQWIMLSLKLSPSPETERLVMGLRAIAVLGLVAIPLNHVILKRLRAIVETVRAGDPFVAANASRLQSIAWVLLTLQLLSLVIGAIGKSVSLPAHPLHLDAGFSVNGWLAVLLTFLLARVFAEGTLMREDLEGTV
jgi:Na+-transporting methylmalonyl-CoA/oxaloacetate decarboxylase gamma subunit